MIKVLKCTVKQKNQLVGEKWDDVSYFNPIQDIDGNWIISIEEGNTSKEDFSWVNDLVEIEYKPVV